MLARLRLSVPDRPGSLGLVASAIGSAGGDIARVDVLESESGRAVDDVHVAVRDAEQLSRVVDRLSAVPGVTVLGSQQPAPPTTGHAELELVDRIVTRPDEALQTLVDGLPGAVGADWAALVDFGAAGGTDPDSPPVLATSPRCPGPGHVRVGAPLRLRPLSLPSYGGGALVPLSGTPLGLVLVRERGPEFHRSELWRLGQIGSIVGGLMRQG